MRYKQNMTMLRKAIFHLVDICRKTGLNFFKLLPNANEVLRRSCCVYDRSLFTPKNIT